MLAASTTRSFVWSFLEQAGSRLLAMIVEIVLARLLVPEMFGVMAILLVFVNVADVVAQSGLGVALVQRQDTTELSYTTALWLSLGIALLLYMGVSLFAPMIASFYQMDELPTYIRVLALVLFFKAYNSIQRSFLQKRMQFRTLFISNTMAVLIAGVVGICLALFEFGVWALIAQSLMQGVSACLLMFVQISWKPALRFDLAEAKLLFGYGWKICVSGILGRLYTGLSDLIIGKACNATDLGYYSNGAKWPTAGLGAFSNALENVFFPVFSSISHDKEALKDAVRRAVVVSTYVMVSIAFFLIVSAEPLIRLLLTEKWIPCAPIFQLTCLMFSFAMVQIVNLRAYMALGDSGLYMRLQIIKVVSGMVFISLVAILTADIYWVAAANTVVTIINIIVVDLHAAQRMVGLGRWAQIKLVAPYFALGAGAALLSYPLSCIGLPDLPTILLQVLVFMLFYLGVSRLLRMTGCLECFSAVKALRERR